MAGFVARARPGANGPVFALVPDRGAIYVGGVLNVIGGAVRNRIAALDPATGLATPWDPNSNGTVRAIAVSGDEVIAGLEGQSGELAAQRITEAELAEIRALHYEMLAAYTRRDLPTYYRINAQIHTCINAAARNPVLTQTWRTVNARLQSLRFRSNFDEAKWKRAVKEHEQMVEGLAARSKGA